MGDTEKNDISTEKLTEEQKKDVAAGNAYLSQGKRAMGLKQYEEACDKLSLAVENLVKVYGELSSELIDPYILSGTALLRNAIAKSDVLGKTQPPVDAKDPDEKKKTSEVVLDKTLRGEKVDKAKFNFEGDESEDDEEGEGEDEDEDGEEVEEEVVEPIDAADELEFAFNSLDLARALLLKDESDEGKKKLARVYSLLAEVASENEQLPEACDEYKRALDLYEQVLPPYDRELAALHFFLAVSLDYLQRTDEAIKEAEKALQVLDLRLIHLKEEKHKLKTEEEKEGSEKEIEEVTQLRQEVADKISEMETAPAPNDEETETDKAISELRHKADAAELPQNNLNSIVKKKKKRESESQDSISKKGKSEE